MVPIVVYKKWDILISNLKYDVATQILIYCRDEKLKYLRMLPPLQYCTCIIQGLLQGPSGSTKSSTRVRQIH